MSSYAPLSAELWTMLTAVPASRDGPTTYRPCALTLTVGSDEPRAYIIDWLEDRARWGVAPADDSAKREVDVSTVTALSESRFRLPPRLADELYGVEGMEP